MDHRTCAWCILMIFTWTVTVFDSTHVCVSSQVILNFLSTKFAPTVELENVAENWKDFGQLVLSRRLIFPIQKRIKNLDGGWIGGGGRRSVTFKVTPVAQGMLLLKHWDVPAVWKQPEHPSLEISLVSLFLTEYMGDVERHFDIWSRAQYIGRWGGWFDQVLCTAEHFTCFMVIWALEANVFRRHGSPVSSLVGIRDFWAQNVLLLGFKIAMLRGIAGKSK